MYGSSVILGFVPVGDLWLVEPLLPAARWTPLWSDVLLGKRPFPGMKAISTVLSWLEMEKKKVRRNCLTQKRNKNTILKKRSLFPPN
uniref:Uncharacterized protein n=1 Tax=Xiphophorus maculatus TaxID=8083 RepID=A0A3B5QQG6_XIPMA